MSLALFSVKNKYYRNGIWWFTKVLNRFVGEERYDTVRISRRVWVNKFYFYRQMMLYHAFIETPDIANFLGIYPKIDSSHGWGFYNTYEMYRDFQENTINSDGAFGMWIAYIAAIYLAHQMYNYFIPWYWHKNASVKNCQEQRNRIRDALASTIIEDQYGMHYAEWGWMPHDHHSVRKRIGDGLSHPDDVRAMHMSTLLRKNRYKQHYLKDLDEKTKMISF